MFKWDFLYFNLCPLPLGLSQDTTEKSLAPSSLLPHQVFIHMSLLSSTLNSPSVFFYEGCCSPFTIFVALCWTCSSTSTSFLHLGAQDWTQHSMHYLLWRKASGQTRPSLALPVILLCVAGQCLGLSSKTPLPFLIQTQDMTELELSFISSDRNILFFQQKQLLLPVWASGCK